MNSCFICGEPAIATGSHIIPNWMITPCVGPRYKEESFALKMNSGKTDTFYGQENAYNNDHQLITEQKANHHTLDHIFCNSCEHELGVIESQLKDHLMCTDEQNKTKNIYKLGKLANGIEYKSYLKVDPILFTIFWYSLAYREFIRNKVIHDQNIINSYEAKYLRKVIYEFIHSKQVSHSVECAKYFHYFVISKLDLPKKDKGFIGAMPNNDHNDFYLCQFVLEFYTKSEKYNPEEIEYSSLLNEFAKLPLVVITSQEAWDLKQYNLKRYNKAFMQNMASRLSEITNIEPELILKEYQAELTSLSEQNPVNLNHFEIAEQNIITRHRS